MQVSTLSMVNDSCNRSLPPVVCCTVILNYVIPCYFCSELFLPYSGFKMDRVCLMNRCSLFCTTCGLRPHFLHFIQTFTMKSKWCFSLGAFHDADHCNIWIASLKIINLPSQHPWAVLSWIYFYKQAIKKEWDPDEIFPLFAACWIWGIQDAVRMVTFFSFFFRHTPLNFGFYFRNLVLAYMVLKW